MMNLIKTITNTREITHHVCPTQGGSIMPPDYGEVSSCEGILRYCLFLEYFARL